jgi:hypothetical protein
MAHGSGSAGVLACRDYRVYGGGGAAAQCVVLMAAAAEEHVDWQAWL